MHQVAWQAVPGGSSQEDGAVQSVTADDIRALLKDSGWLTVDASTLSEQDDLYAAGLTSHGSVNLMLALEERFDVEFPEQLLRRRTFESIAAIRGAVASLLAGNEGGSEAA